MDGNDMMTGYMTLQQIAEEAGCQGKIFMQNIEGEEIFMFMLDGDELTRKATSIRPEPAMIYLSELNTNSDDKEKNAVLLSINQTVQYSEEAEDSISECIYEWQNSVISLGVILDTDEQLFILKSAFPLPNGIEALAPRVLMHAVETFRLEAGKLYDMLALEITGGETA